MSSGEFSRSKYETNNGDIVNIRVQPETLAASIGGAANAAPAGAVTAGFPSALAGGSRRRIGINARTVSFIPDADIDDYKPGQILRVPVLTQARWDAVSRGSTMTYLGQAGQVVGKSAEQIN